MPVLKNARHEKFAQLLAKLHGKMTVADAHEQAGYRRNDGNASVLAQHPDIQARVKEIKGRAAAKTVLEVEDLIHMQDEFRQLAKENKQYSIGVNAVKEMASGSSAPKLAHPANLTV
jgi:phage terminase small subunit